jgi:SAM-dependent methyltransferase
VVPDRLPASSVQALLDSYPRGRPKLPAGNAKIYLEEYQINRGQRGGLLYRASAMLESWMHRRIAAAHGPGDRILEFGAGTLNHLKFEPTASRYDVVEPMKALLHDSPLRRRIDCEYRSVFEIDRSRQYDRVLSVAVLEHLEEMPAIIAASGRLLREGGIFQAGIPAEGGFIWGLSWRLTTGIAYRARTGLAYAPVMRHEHINTAAEILAVLDHLFSDVRVRWFPLPHRHLAFYGYIEARGPRLARCDKILRERAG